MNEKKKEKERQAHETTTTPEHHIKARITPSHWSESYIDLHGSLYVDLIMGQRRLT